MGNPLVSVLMTAYNREGLIAESIESVLHSGYDDFELIISDDCSCDQTVAIAREFEKKDERIRVVINDVNMGDYPNRNKVAYYARGKYIKYVDSDDKLIPGGLEYCVQCMEMFKEADWAIIYPIEILREYLLDSTEAIQAHFFQWPFLKAGPGQTMIKKDFFYKIGMYPVKYGPACDMYFNLQAASIGKTLVIKDNFLFYRRHANQEQSNQFSYLYNYNKYLKDAFENLPLPLSQRQLNWLQKKRKRRFAVNITRYFFQTRSFSATRQAINKADFTFKDYLQGIFH